MNIAMTEYEDLVREFSADTKFEKRSKRSSEAPAGRKFGRRGKSPRQFNGMHRRRNKKIKW